MGWANGAHAPRIRDRVGVARRASRGRGRFGTSSGEREGMRLLVSTTRAAIFKSRNAGSRTRRWPIPGLWECRLARVALHPCVDQGVGQADHVAQARSILQPRQRRLGTQIPARVRQATAGQLECRIRPQMIEVVGVLVAAADREHAGAEHIDKGCAQPASDRADPGTPGPNCRPNRDAARPSPEASRPRSRSDARHRRQL